MRLNDLLNIVRVLKRLRLVETQTLSAVSYQSEAIKPSKEINLELKS